MSSAVSWINATYGVVGPTGPTGPAGPAGPTGATGPASPAKVVQFYKNAVQTAGSGQILITWDVASSFNDAGYVSFTPGSATLTILQRGLYQIDMAILNNAGGATWTSLVRGLSLNVTRSPFASVQALNDNIQISSGQSYNQSTVGTLELYAGDVCTVNLGQTLSSGSTLIQPAGTLPDLNTSVTFTFLRATS
jgi:hypothetical protein